MIFTSSIHCSLFANGKSLTWSVLPTADAAPMQELLNSTQCKVNKKQGGGKEAKEKHEKKGMIQSTYHCMELSCISLKTVQHSTILQSLISFFALA